jgi:hypothetical protein
VESLLKSLFLRRKNLLSFIDIIALISSFKCFCLFINCESSRITFGRIVSSHLLI